MSILEASCWSGKCLVLTGWFRTILDVHYFNLQWFASNKLLDAKDCNTNAVSDINCTNQDNILWDIIKDQAWHLHEIIFLILRITRYSVIIVFSGRVSGRLVHIFHGSQDQTKSGKDQHWGCQFFYFSVINADCVAKQKSFFLRFKQIACTSTYTAWQSRSNLIFSWYSRWSNQFETSLSKECWSWLLQCTYAIVLSFSWHHTSADCWNWNIHGNISVCTCVVYIICWNS